MPTALKFIDPVSWSKVVKEAVTSMTDQFVACVTYN